MNCQYKPGCNNKPDPKVNKYFCEKCDKERKEKITKQLIDMVKKFTLVKRKEE